MDLKQGISQAETKLRLTMVIGRILTDVTCTLAGRRQELGGKQKS